MEDLLPNYDPDVPFDDLTKIKNATHFEQYNWDSGSHIPKWALIQGKNYVAMSMDSTIQHHLKAIYIGHDLIKKVQEIKKKKI